VDDAFRQLYREHLAHLEQKYAALLAKEGYDALIIHSGTARLRSSFDDTYWPLRPVPHFQHWLPLVTADSALVIASGKRPRLLWLHEQNFWEAPPDPEPHEWQNAFEVMEVETAPGLRAMLPQGRVGLVTDNRELASAWGMEASLNPPSLMKPLDQLRVKKSAYEIRCIEEANRRAGRGHRAVREAFDQGCYSELELHLFYLRATEQDDADTPYKNIVALNQHAATLHHVSYGRNKPSQASSSLLLDAGATCYGYASDITRTYVRGQTEAASAFGELVRRTERMQQQLCTLAKVGQPYEQLHERAHLEVGAILHDIGVCQMSPEEQVAAGVTRAFFPHGLGHSLGLQTHDVGCAEVKPKNENPFLRNTTSIAPDQVFTIEPGIYFIDALLEGISEDSRVDWPLCHELAKLGGVRIEDDLVVGPDGLRNLTRPSLP
jgi:Xaa-Pro dipeptidase